MYKDAVYKESGVISSLVFDDMALNRDGKWDAFSGLKGSQVVPEAKQTAFQSSSSSQRV